MSKEPAQGCRPTIPEHLFYVKLNRPDGSTKKLLAG
jgi:hypothetical protein